MRLRAGAVVALVLASGVANGAAVGAPTYSCVRLAGVDHKGQHAHSAGINSRGEVVGNGQFYETTLTASEWRADGSLDVLFRNWRASQAYGINDAGQVAGYVTLNDHGERPAIWSEGETTLLPTLAGREGAGHASAINNHGQVVGSSTLPWTGEWRWHATLWNNGKAIDLGTLDEQYDSRAVGLNDAGVVVGFNEMPDDVRRAMRWTLSSTAELPPLPGGTRARAVAVNNKGAIVGASTTGKSKGLERAVLWKGGRAINLGVLPGDRESYASAINDDGVIVGHSSIGYSEGTAVVWYPSSPSPIDVNTLIAEGGCVDELGGVRRVTDLTGINDRGDIAATAFTYGPKGGLQVTSYKLVPLN